MAVENRLERGEQFFNRKFRKIPEPAIVDADHRNFLVPDHARGRDHCAIAAQHQHQIDTCGQILVFDRLNDASRFVLDALAIDIQAADEFDTARVQPFRQTAERCQRVRLVRLDDDTYAFD